MLFDNPASNIGLARWYLDSVDALYSANGQLVLDSRVASLGLQNWQSAFYPGTTQFPAFYAGFNGGYSLFVGGGTQNAIQGQTLLDGYTDYAGQDETGDLNSYLKQCVNAIIQPPMGNGLLNATVCTFGGHSLGGAIAAALALVAYNLNPRPNIKVTQFGSPRSGGYKFTQKFGAIDCARWMNSDDPVPLVPPTVQQAPIALLALPVSQMRIFENQRHVEGGLQLDPEGNLSAAELPADAVIRPTTSLAYWLASLAQGTASPHNVAEYRSRLIQYQNQSTTFSHTNPAGAAVEGGPQVNNAAINAQVREARAGLVGDGITQASGPLIIPKPRLFSKRKFGSVWYVTLGGTPIAVGPRRKKAGLMAQAGNLLLRRLQREGFVDPIAFQAAFADYLTAAADPNSGIKPTLPVGPV